MTIEQAKQQLLNWLQSQLGTRESGDNWNKYAEDPNMTRLLGWKAQNQPWCNIFCNAAFISVFGLETGAAMIYQPVGGGSAACRTSAQFFKNNGAFFSEPEVGDVIFFYSGGAINHQGIVVRTGGGNVSTIEGNSSDMVASRSYSTGNSIIAGYGRPKWELVAKSMATTSGTTPISSHKEESIDEMVSISVPVLRSGANCAAVAAMQELLKFKKFSLGFYGVDGDFGPSTLNALKAFQSKNQLTADGVCGAKTWEALFR